MTTPYYSDDLVTLWHGDCLAVLRTLPDASVDAVVTDPPYNLSFMAKPWDAYEGREDAGFAYWLSGLIDGEGHFGIKVHARGTHAPHFALKLRADERGTLERIRRSLGVGTITDEKREPNPMVKYVIQDKAGCQRLVDLLDKYPLRAKKQQDYWTWREAVCEWTSRPRGNRWHGRADNTRMAGLRDRLMEGRAYTDIPWSGHEFQDWCRLWTAECLRVLKPGGHLLAFGGTRTWHRLACAVEDAGFEVRDSIAWLYGSGFPKSLRVSRDEHYCHCDASVHTSSRTSPELQPDDHTRTAVDAGPVGGAGRSAPRATSAPLGSPADCRPERDSDGGLPHPAGANAPASPLLQGCAPTRTRSVGLADGRDAESSRTPSQARRSDHPSNQDCDPPSHSQTSESTHTRANTSPADTSESAHRTLDSSLDPSPLYGTGFPVCTTCGKPNVDGLGTALKPSFEPIVVARKPLSSTVAANVLTHGTGALNIDATRVGDEPAFTDRPGRKRSGGIMGRDAGTHTTSGGAGRWPANVVLDESQAAALDEQSGEARSAGLYEKGSRGFDPETGKRGDAPFGVDGLTSATYGDSGGASRFFYVAKADASERVRVNGTAHPTVKPLTLMRWLVRLVTPPGGTVLEPFAGSGTTVEACILEGFHCIAIERESDYLPLIVQRINRRRNPVEAVRGSGEDGGLFDLLEEGA